MFFKIHHGAYGKLVAVCDENVCGKTLKDKGEIEFFVNPRFYKDRQGSKAEILDLLRDTSDANFVGEKAVQLGIEAGLIHEENVIKIQGVPHAQFARIVV